MTTSELVRASIPHVEELMSWCRDGETVSTWGGPLFRYPFSRESFLEDVCWERMPTFVLLDTTGTMIGFGQTYEKEAAPTAEYGRRR